MEEQVVRRKLSQVAEIRFREGLGQRYMADDITVRCQGVSRAYLRRKRQETNNPHLTANDVWPEGQCTKPAVPGTFLCKYHGGESPSVNRRAVIQYMPIDLATIVDELMSEPEYLSRHLEIRSLQARIAQLYRELSEGGRFSRATTTKVNTAVEMIENGSVEEGIDLIRIALRDNQAEREIWDEIRKTIDLIQSLTRTEVNSLQVLRTMASAEQVMALVEGIATAFIGLIKERVVPHDRRLADGLTIDFIRELRRLTNARLGPKAVSMLGQGTEVQPEEVEVVYDDGANYS